MTADLEFFDARHYELMLTVDRAGLVEIQHQAGDDRRTERVMARLAAEIADELGHDRIPQAGIAVHPPGRGLAVMPCSLCRRMLDAADMRRFAGRSGLAAVIVCEACA